MDPVVLSYHDSLLRESDVSLLRGPHWLNDALVGFFMEHLQHAVHVGRKDLLFVSPEVTQCLKLGGCAEANLFLEPLSFHNKNFVFFPLNDCQSPQAGGTHWSLLVVSRPERRIFHWDSMRGSNREAAARLVDVLALGFAFSEVECRQQDNCFDCGVFAICHAEAVAQASRSGGVAATQTLMEDCVNNKREALLSLIDLLTVS